MNANPTTIRQLLTLGTDWQAATVKSSLFSGVLAVILAVASFVFFPAINAREFVFLWGGYCIVSLIIAWNLTTKSLTDAASQDADAAIRLIALTFLPALLTAAVFSTVIALFGGTLGYVAFMWMVFYGLALLAMQTFAPRPLIYLGWAFLLTGLVVSLGLTDRNLDGTLLMGLFFGGYHLAYAFLARR